MFAYSHLVLLHESFPKKCWELCKLVEAFEFFQDWLLFNVIALQICCISGQKVLLQKYKFYTNLKEVL